MLGAYTLEIGVLLGVDPYGQKLIPVRGLVDTVAQLGPGVIPCSIARTLLTQCVNIIGGEIVSEDSECRATVQLDMSVRRRRGWPDLTFNNRARMRLAESSCSDVANGPSNAALPIGLKAYFMVTERASTAIRVNDQWRVCFIWTVPRRNGDRALTITA